MIRYGILGQVEARDGTGKVPIAQGRQRLLLAVLLVHANQAVSTDRLIDALWGETAPPTAARSLHNLVSALRKVLGDGRLVTDGRGYRLDVADGELDAQRFELVSGLGRDALDTGDIEGAAQLLREALELWCGPAFGDLAYEHVLQAEAARLDERRFVTIEDRVDAELARGRHAEVVAELEVLVAEHPLRERLRGQQILALYRSGRQADALAAYADTRRHLVDELGLDPSPQLRDLELAVLEQDPALAWTRPSRAGAAPARRSVRRLWLVAAAGAVLITAGAVVAFTSGSLGARSGGAAALTGDLLVTIDPQSAKVSDQVTVGGTPTSVTVGGGAAWTLNTDDRTISRVDLETHAVRSFSTEAPTVDLAAGSDALWVAQATPVAAKTPAFNLYAMPSSVVRVDPLTGAAEPPTPLRLPRQNTIRVPPGELLAVDENAVWVVTRPGWVQRLDIRTGQLLTVRAHQATAIATGDGQVWTYDLRRRGVVRLDPRTGRALYTVPVAAEWVDAVAVGAGAVWVTDTWAGVVWRVDPELRTARTIDATQGVDSVAVGEGAVWASSSVSGTVSRIDPATYKVTTVKVPGTPRSVTTGGGRVWVSVAGARQALPASGALAADAHVKALPGPPCGAVITGRDGDPDYLIAADLPFANLRDSTVPMSEAVAFVLRQHDFRAGKFTLGLQTCDDASAETGIFDPLACRANARLYANNPAVLGIVGPLNSGCTEYMLPVLNKAERGPPSLVSPANSDPELLRDEPARAFDVLGELYPTGQRGYARPWPSDDSEIAAGVLLAQRQQPGGSVFLLQDRDITSHGLTWIWFRRAANRAGLEIAGHASWAFGDHDYRALADRIHRSGAQVVYFAGALTGDMRRLIRAVRAAVGPDATFIGAGLLPVSLLFAGVGPAARGMLITSQGLTPESLGAAGRNFVKEFAATQPTGRVTTLDVYAAAATEVLLDAIARSDGTRESVARALKDTDLADSVVGRLTLDANGEPDAQPISVVRALHGGSRQDLILDTTGSELVDVIDPPARLVGPAG